MSLDGSGRTVLAESALGNPELEIEINIALVIPKLFPFFKFFLVFMGKDVKTS